MTQHHQTFFAVLNFHSSNHFSRQTHTRHASNMGNYPEDMFFERLFKMYFECSVSILAERLLLLLQMSKSL